jgi:hypothetical protein
MPKSTQEQILHSQKNEITEYHIYSRLSRSIKKKRTASYFNALQMMSTVTMSSGAYIPGRM